MKLGLMRNIKMKNKTNNNRQCRDESVIPGRIQRQTDLRAPRERRHKEA